jgi:hypothetical protein
MEDARASWNDDRLNGLNDRMQAGLSHVDDRFNSLEARFDAMQRTMLLVMASILVGFATLVASQI